MLHFVLGDKSCGKSQALYQEALRLDAQKQHVFFIAPEQSTLAVQEQLLQVSPNGCILNIEVLSFNRLAHRLFEELGMPQGNPLDDLGKSLLLYKVTRDHKNELLYYTESYKKPGFIGRLKLFLTEMEQYTPEEGGNLPQSMLQFSEETDEPSVLKQKLHDLQIIYDAYIAEMGTTLYNSEHILDDLTLKIKNSPKSAELLQNAVFFLDDFSGFTPQQYRLIGELLNQAKDMWVALTLPPEAYANLKNVQNWRDLEVSLFHETSKTYLKLVDMASNMGKKGQEVCLKSCDKKPVVYAATYDNFEAELNQALKQMLHLMRAEGYRMRDMALLMPGVDDKAHYIARRMETYGFSYHLNNKKPLKMHPIAQLVLQSIRMVESDYSLDTVLSFLKTHLTPLTEEHLYVLETKAKEKNIQGKAEITKWLKSVPAWKDSMAVCDAILAFDKAVGRGGPIMVADFIEAQKAFFEALGVKQILAVKQNELNELISQAQNSALSSQYSRAKEEYSACDTFYEQTLTQMGLHLGAERLKLSEIFDVFAMSFSQTAVSVVPSSVDSLMVADINGSRLKQVKALFVLGLSEKNFPGDGTNPGLFSQKERAQLNDKFELAPEAVENIQLKYFNLYSLLGKATEAVYLSYPLATSDGKKAEPCLIWQDLTSGEFARFDKASPWPVWDEATLPTPYLEENGLDLPDEANKYLRNLEPQLMRSLDNGRKAKPIKEKIKAETAQKLFDNNKKSYNITNLESYANCPFAFFMLYGLEIKQPKEPMITALDNGLLIHEILERAKDALGRFSDNPADWTEEACREDVKKTMDTLEAGTDYEKYQATARNRYYWRKLHECATNSLIDLSNLVVNSDFKPSAFEWKFGEVKKTNDQDGNTLQLKLQDHNGNDFSLSGKIDRIDVLEDGGERYITIVDYKSGATAFDEKELRNGTQIQLPIYMKAACDLYDPHGDGTNAPKTKGIPAGYFYFHVIEAPGAKHTNGRILEDRTITDKLDKKLATNGKSDFYQLEYTQNGFHRSHSKTATPDQFKEYENIALENVQNAVTDIRAGEIGCNPIDEEGNMGEPKGCAFCAFKGKCGLDRRFGDIPRRVIIDKEGETKTNEEKEA